MKKEFYEVEALEKCITELEENYGLIWVLDANELYMYNSILGSIARLDNMLWLFDLTDEVNLENANQLATVISDHINCRYNVSQPWSPMVDYEITNIQWAINYHIKNLELEWEFDSLPEQVKKNRKQTVDMLKQARAAQKIANDKAKAEYDEMEAKQQRLDQDKQLETAESLTEFLWEEWADLKSEK